MTTPPDRYGTGLYGVAHYARANSGGTKMNQQLRVRLDFASAPDATLDEFTKTVLTDMTGNAAVPTPPVALADVETQRQAFSDALADMEQGGTTATATKNNARAVLVASLRQLALYVQTKCNNDLATLHSTGFQAASTTHAQQPLETPSIVNLTNGTTGQLLARVKPIANARAYEARFAVLGAGNVLGPWQGGGIGTDSRAIPINGLTPGTNYTVEIRAVGGSTGFSEWSNAVSHMSL